MGFKYHRDVIGFRILADNGGTILATGATPESALAELVEKGRTALRAFNQNVESERAALTPDLIQELGYCAALCENGRGNCVGGPDSIESYLKVQAISPRKAGAHALADTYGAAAASIASDHMDGAATLLAQFFESQCLLNTLATQSLVAAYWAGRDSFEMQQNERESTNA
jgi:hypothetical protein